LAYAHGVAGRYVEHLRVMAEMEAERARLLAEFVQAYAWPHELPIPERPDAYRAQLVGGVPFGEDLTCEVAVAEAISTGAAWHLVRDVADLTRRLPICWAKIAGGEAPLWVGRRIVQACEFLDDEGWGCVDALVGPCLGAVGWKRLGRVLRAAVIAADPDGERRRAAASSCRFVHTGGDETDSLAGWVSARLDRADALGLEAAVQGIADLLAGEDAEASADVLRARALGVLANPAAALRLIGALEDRPSDLSREPGADDSEAYLAEAARDLAPQVRVCVHVCSESLDDPDALVRVEGAGPLLTSQVAQLTHGCQVKLTPVVHVGGAGVGVDSYEVPRRIREEVIARNPHDVFPWSSVESARLDLDHTIPWTPGGQGQTSQGNLGPLDRRAHRVKTHAGWTLDQPAPGVFLWNTPSGQAVLVDATGSHRLPMRE